MQSNKDFGRELEERLINFAVLIVEVVNGLPDNRVSNHLGGQLLRSGTSPALNYSEALGAESRNDFIHKLGVSLKELRETQSCLQVLARTNYMKKDDLALIEGNELISILVKSIQTLKKASSI